MMPTNAANTQAGKRNSLEDSLSEQARRADDLQRALLAVAESCGFPLSYLKKPSPWYEAGRDPVEYEPYRPYMKEQEMLRDLVATAARIGTAEQRDSVRLAVRAYFETRADDALEMIGTEMEAEVVALTLDTKKEVSEAECATITALNSRTPEAFQKAAEENGEALTLMEQLQASLEQCARRGRKLQVMR